MVAGLPKFLHGVTAWVFIPVIVVLTSLEVLMRYVFHAPLEWSEEVIALTLLLTSMAASSEPPTGHHGRRDADRCTRCANRRHLPGTRGYPFLILTVLLSLVLIMFPQTALWLPTWKNG